MINERIRELRESQNKKQEEVASYLHVTQSTYSKYELGKIDIPIGAYIKLADYYGVNIDYLVGRCKK